MNMLLYNVRICKNGAYACICLEYIMIRTVLNERLQYDYPTSVDHQW